MLGDEAYVQLLGMIGSGPGVGRPAAGPPRPTGAPFRHFPPDPMAGPRPAAGGRGGAELRKGSGTYVRAAGQAPSLAFGPLGNIPEVRDFLEFRCSRKARRPRARRRPPTRRRWPGWPRRIGRWPRRWSPVRRGWRRISPSTVPSPRPAATGISRSPWRHWASRWASASRSTRELNARPLAERAPILMQEHDRIHAAIAAGDAAARAAMQDHLTSGIRRLFGS